MKRVCCDPCKHRIRFEFEREGAVVAIKKYTDIAVRLSQDLPAELLSGHFRLAHPVHAVESIELRVIHIDPGIINIPRPKF